MASCLAHFRSNKKKITATEQKIAQLQKKLQSLKNKEVIFAPFALRKIVEELELTLGQLQQRATIPRIRCINNLGSEFFSIIILHINLRKEDTDARRVIAQSAIGVFQNIVKLIDSLHGYESFRKKSRQLYLTKVRENAVLWSNCAEEFAACGCID